MIKLGLQDKAFERMSQTLGPEMDDPEMDEGSGKPKVLNVEKYVLSNETGKEFDYEKFINASPEEIMGISPMSVEELSAYVQEYYQTDLEEEIQETMDYVKIRYPESILDMDVFESAMRKGKIGERGNIYNWSWWGPTFDFTLLGPVDPAVGDGDPYSEGVLLLSPHRGGDVRNNYGIPQAFKLNSYAEEAPWYAYRLYVDITTDKGSITLDSEDDEAYHFTVGIDENGIFGEGKTVSYDELENKLNWEEFGARGIW